MKGNFKKLYDYLVVGAGLFGAIFAYEANKWGKKVLVIDKRNHMGGNCYCENIEGINVHKYGPHIFHTSNKEVWEYINQFVNFNNYINSPIAYYKGEIYNLPFNMNTFNKLWGVVTPDEAKLKIKEQIRNAEVKKIQNLKEKAISLVGTDIFEKLIKGYTEKQWGRNCTELPAFIIERLPVRFKYDNNYFDDKYQGIPIGGYNKMFKKLLNGIKVKLNSNFFENKEEYGKISEKIVYTGMIDQFYNYKFGVLEYRSLKFENEILDINNYQGNAIVNYTEREIPYTRIVEHKHFEYRNQKKTVITKEYPIEYEQSVEPYYPVNDEKNNVIFEKYKKLTNGELNVIFGGRLADYKYYNMDQVVWQAITKARKERGN